MKKLWNRTRSRSRRGSELQPATLEKNVPPIPQLPRTSQTTNRPKSTTTVKPVLVGVSRNADYSRPGTAGSMQDAVRLAADTTSQEFAGGHTKQKLPRYVDIFSVSSPSGSRSITSSYNEEVAERNLDTRVVRGEQYYGYIPTSKYQEDVALRNSYQSSDPPRSSHDRQHRSWISSGTESGHSKGPTPHTSWFQDNSRPNSHGPAAISSQPLPPIRASLESTSTNAAPANSTLSNYNLSKAEVSQPRPIDQQHPPRSSSRMSTSSNNVINLQHRTIMDLTADEEDEMPELELKTSRDMWPGPVQLVRVVSPPASRPSTESAVAGASPIIAQETFSATPLTPDRSVSRRQDRSETDMPKSTSAFSMINTVASFSPAAVKETGDAAVKEPISPTSSTRLTSPEIAKNRLSTVAETEHVATVEDKTNVSPPTAVADGPELDNHVADGESAPQPVLPAQAETRSPANLTPLQASKNIHNSPESLQSVDFTNPSTAFGVRTRDFAMQPSKSSLKADQEANTSAKVSKAATAGMNAERTRLEAARVSDPYHFDEEAFKRKQDRARAALIKLQQSLNEDFILPPRTQSAPRPNGTDTVGQRRVYATKDPGDANGPAAPTSADSITNAVDHSRGRSRLNPSQPQSRDTNTAVDSGSSNASVITIRPSGRGSRQPLTQSQSYTIPAHHVVDIKGKGKERDIETALLDLQSTAQAITGPPRVSSAQPRPPRSPLRQRKSAANSQGMHGYGFGQMNEHLQAVHTPTSPGEVSLSNFPLAPIPTQQVQIQSRDDNDQRPSHNRNDSNDPFVDRNSKMARNAPSPFASSASMTSAPPKIRRPPSVTSQGSHMTSASQYSIPFHMIPERGSSMRDSLVKEVDAVAGTE